MLLPVILRNSEEEIYDALEGIIAGTEKKTPAVREEKRRPVAYHGNFLSPRIIRPSPKN